MTRLASLRIRAAVIGVIVPSFARAHVYPASLIVLWDFLGMGIVAVACLVFRTSVLSRLTAFVLGLLACALTSWFVTRSPNAAQIGYVASFMIGMGPPLVASTAYLFWSKRLER